MCGRVVQKTPLGEIRVLFETVNPVPNAAPTYNGAPTDTLPVVRLNHDGRRCLDLLRWGLVPWWVIPEKCTGCGECLDYCPAPGALVQYAA